MGTINLTNSRQRDAIVNTRSVREPRKVRYVDEQGRQVVSARLLKCTLAHEAEALAAQAGGLDALSQVLIDQDPDVDLEIFGQQIQETSRIYVTPDQSIVHRVQVFEIVRAPDGAVRERRPLQISEANTAVEGAPLRWTGKLMPRKSVYNRFVFSSKLQVTHVNGLTYDFLFGIAKELEEKDAMMLIGAGPKGTQPLVFVRGGSSYRGFLEGRTKGDHYCLLLHLTNLELKAPEPSAAAPAANPNEGGAQ